MGRVYYYHRRAFVVPGYICKSSNVCMCVYIYISYMYVYIEVLQGGDVVTHLVLLLQDLGNCRQWSI